MDVAARELRLKQIYLDALPNRLLELRNAVEALYDSDDAEQALFAIYRSVHNLAGSSATYGFEIIGDKASEMEAWIEQFRQQKALPSQDDRQQLQLYLNAIKQVSEEVLSAS